MRVSLAERRNMAAQIEQHANQVFRAATAPAMEKYLAVVHATYSCDADAIAARLQVSKEYNRNPTVIAARKAYKAATR